MRKYPAYKLSDLLDEDAELLRLDKILALAYPPEEVS